MPKGTHTVAELAKAVAVLQTRDARRAREVKALQGRVGILEERPRSIKIVGSTRDESPISPATNSTAGTILPIPAATAGAARFSRVRSFLSWLRS